MFRIDIPARRPVQVGFSMTEQGTELIYGNPGAWHDVDDQGVVAVWNGHGTLRLVPEAAPFMDELLVDYAAYWTNVDFPDPTNGEVAWEVVARVFCDFLQVYVGDPLGKTLMQLLDHPEYLCGWIADFIPAYDREIIETDNLIEQAYNEAKEGMWN